MLRSLHISNYILIDSLDVEFPEGLVIITGQTGAGKSILLGALSLAGGGKAEASMVGKSADNCVVEVEYTLPDDSLRDIVEEAGAQWQGRDLIIRRVLNSTGRSRCFVNDCPVAVQTLQELSSNLVDIHSQHNSLLLVNRRFQMSVLDGFASNSELLSDCAAAWNELRRLEAERSGLQETLSRLNEESDYNRTQFKQLEQAGLRDGELEELQEEQKILAHAEQIKLAYASSLELLSAEHSDGTSVSSSLKDAQRQLSQISAYAPQASGLSSRMESLRIELSDICSELDSLNSRMDFDPSRLEVVEQRQSLLYSLLRKHSCADIKELIALRDSLSGSLASSEDISRRLSELEKEIAGQKSLYEDISRRLGESRRKAAPEFSASICSSMQYLELENAVFSIELTPSSPGPSGCDEVRFLFSSNGTAPVDLAKCASGGELSRIMLSLKALMARYASMPTLVFDEIDTGVSGSVADRMGRMICSMGKDMQVMSITHLPQVAAKGDAHFVVEKKMGADNTMHSGLRRVQGRERTMEIARLLSGAEITEQAIANAESLLKDCR